MLGGIEVVRKSDVVFVVFEENSFFICIVSDGVLRDRIRFIFR